MKTLLQNDTTKKALTILGFILAAVFFSLLLSSCTAFQGMQGQNRHHRDQERYMKRYHSEVRARVQRRKKGWYTNVDNVSTVTGVEYPKTGL